MLMESLQKDADSSLKPLVINDFTPGLISQVDYGDMPLGACRDCENVIFKPGRMVKRMGYEVKNPSIPAIGDGVAWFYDEDGDVQIALWANGNLYSVDTATFALTLVQASAYTAGLRVAHAVLSRKLYFSDGETIFGGNSGMRFYDPVGAPGTAATVVSSGGLGSIDTPAAKVLCVRAGQLVMGRVKYVGGTYAKDSIIWSNVLDPNTILGTNIYRVGEGQGGEVNCVLNMSVTVANSYFDGMFCGLSEGGVFMLKGALTPSTLTNVQLPSATGVLDGASAKYIPSAGGATVMYLGSDRRVYATNGIDNVEISGQISDELRDYIIDRNTAIANPQYTSCLNQKDGHYVLDVGGGRQYCYDWNQKNWTKYNRWVSGYWVEAKDSHANPTMYVLSHTETKLVEQNIGTTDDGVPIAPFWKSGWLIQKDDDGDTNKIYKWAYVSYQTDQGNMTLTATVNQGQGRSATAIFTPEAGTGSGASSLWDSAIWDSSVWNGTVTVGVTPYKQKKRLFVQLSNGKRGKLQGHDVQVTLSPTTDGWFEPLNVNILYLQGGRKHVAA